MRFSNDLFNETFRIFGVFRPDGVDLPPFVGVPTLETYNFYILIAQNLP